MNFVVPELTLALPELVVLAMACLVLVVDLYLDEKQRHVTYILSQLTLLAGFVITAVYYSTATEIGFHGHYVKDAMGDVLKLVIFVATATVFLYSRDYLKERGMFKGEYYVLGLLGVLGMMIMVSAHSLLTIYLGLELFSLCLYALVAFNRESPAGAEAAMKLFVLSALASGMLLYGISMLYGATGSVIMEEVARSISEQGADNVVLAFGLAFVVVGLGFKLSAVPFHMWVPDVYQGAPTSVTLYVGSAPELAAFAMTIRLLVDGLGGLHADWQQMLIVLAVLSIGVGNVVAIAQTNIKRMLAYSAISHMGFIMLGILAGTASGYAAAMFYAITYVLMVVGAFGVILVLSSFGFEAENLEDFRGLNDRNAWFAFLMLVLMMSMAGVPFLVGFYAKLAVLEAIIDVELVWLAVYAVVLSVIGAFYYLRVVKLMYFDKLDHPGPVHASMDTRIVISANGMLVIALGVYPGALMSLCQTVWT